MNTDSNFVSVYCQGEKCHCGKPAVKKISEVILPDEDKMRHELTQYVCGEHFDKAVRPYVKYPDHTPPEGKGYSLEALEKRLTEFLMDKSRLMHINLFRDANSLSHEFFASLPPQPVKDDWVDRIEKRIAELNKADAEFCKDRWNTTLPEIQKSLAREMSNQVTFARQVLQEFLPNPPQPKTHQGEQG